MYFSDIDMMSRMIRSSSTLLDLWWILCFRSLRWHSCTATSRECQRSRPSWNVHQRAFASSLIRRSEYSPGLGRLWLYIYHRSNQILDDLGPRVLSNRLYFFQRFLSVLVCILLHLLVPTWMLFLRQHSSATDMFPLAIPLSRMTWIQLLSARDIRLFLSELLSVHPSLVVCGLIELEMVVIGVGKLD